ncbi:sugar phosphate isomerase/epimerase family protein [Acetobacter oeni]|uniref:Xylose isomerase n=1 Tax=Acetobacter oeni TaxID=304077 RepID=A0A511XQG9_9PROT|nr:sugar phosphate isomerase/epimerase family protein [Acetobacter oeni]MBB3882481.1 sugar phosphate isomerase/epimerase [Acetobacter oeni]NHO18705.1 TIM barrel protein [Acetobacter oeni]GBR05452.1 4-hydroxyphenylpyruvate dioxygenase [Acetobacter oeni LMG 21952]GEN65192.1 xylose isomerase [Acetobacter oeni]
MTEGQNFPFLFGVNEFTTQPWSFEEDVRRYQELGVQAIEVCEAKLDAGRVAEQMKYVAGSGMKISSVQPAVRTFFGSRMMPSPEGTEARVKAFRKSLEILAPFTPGSVFVCNTGAPPAGNVRKTIDDTVRYLRELCPLAADLGVSIALEPLNPVSMNVESAIWTIAQTMDVIDAVGHRAMGLCLDYWNIWQENDVEAQIRRAGDRITVVQASDWRVPYSAADRLVPGDGAIPLGALMKATREAGFRGACTVEIFSDGVPDSLYDGDLREVIRRSRAGLEKAWQAIG